MSLHNNPKYQIPALVDALKQHGLEHNIPSQLADAFRTGWVAALATPAQAATPDMTDAYAGAREDLSIWKKRALEAEALNRKFAASVNSPSFMGEPAAPTQAGEYPAGTGNPEADRIIGRLASSDPDFDDCADAVALIHKLVAEIKGPDGFDTWKDAAIADRAAHRAAQAAPVDAAAQEDAERWQFLAEYLVGTRTDLDDEIVGCDSVQKMARVLDAARAAQEGKHD